MYHQVIVQFLFFFNIFTFIISCLPYILSQSDDINVQMFLFLTHEEGYLFIDNVWTSLSHSAYLWY